MSYGIFEVLDRRNFGDVITLRFRSYAGADGRHSYPTIQEAEQQRAALGDIGRRLDVIAAVPLRGGGCLPL